MHRARAPFVALAILLGGTAMVPAASAHDGAGAAFDGAAGPYRVLGYDGAPGPQGAVEFVAVLQDDRARPLDGAQVRVTARRQGGSAGGQVGPVTAEGIANVYRYRLPDAGPWDVTLRVADALGQGTATFTVHAEPGTSASAQTDGSTAAALPRSLTGAALALAAVAWAVHVARRWRRRGSTRVA